MKKTCLILLLFISFSAMAQINYVLNPSFEDHTGCPTNTSQIRLANNWSAIDTAIFEPLCSPEYCHVCSLIPAVKVPHGGFYYHYPKSGDGMANIQTYSDEVLPSQPYKRDYLQGRFSQQLTAGKSYCVTFYVALTQASTYAANHIAAYIDNGAIDNIDSEGCASPQTQITPQIVEDTIITDTIGWTRIEGIFVATGDERFITIGNFSDKAHTQTIPWPGYEGGGSGFCWYLVDDVSIIESNHLPFAGNDTIINAGDSVFLGPHEIALPYVWYKYGNATPIDSGGGTWVHPDTTTRYVLEQTLCGVKTYDTVRVQVGTDNVINVGNVDNVLLYPNPAKDVVNIANAVGTTVTVYDVVGKKVKEVAVTENRMQVSIGDLAGGVYLVEIRDPSTSLRVTKWLVHNTGAE